MNRVYTVVFNRTLGLWQCVSELARRGKKVKSCQSINQSINQSVF
ncbi:MAG: ESPR domain-containing protein [Pasteurellaceae bacterium]|nr:ESPR domain-containing protein [Pasteurellaceae bacterium]